MGDDFGGNRDGGGGSDGAPRPVAEEGVPASPIDAPSPRALIRAQETQEQEPPDRGAYAATVDAVSLLRSMPHGATRDGEEGGVTERASALGPGSLIAHYQVRRELGHGASGVVLLARDTQIGRSVALKVFARGRHAQRFLAEARVIAKLDHPHIVKLWDYGESESYLFLALSYVDGETLADRTRREVMTPHEAFCVLRAIAEALEHAHQNGVVHCDLKPGNVMICRDGSVRVVDFGIAQTDEGKTRGGTPEWMAPEQWSGPDVAEITDRVDSWALGVIAHQLLTGEHPIGETHEARVAFVLDPEREAHVALPGHLPVGVRELVLGALGRAPELRPTMSEWRRRLDEAINGLSDSSLEDGPYPGLLPFDAQRSRYFVGREAEIDEVLERLRRSPSLPIVGPSGTGKSSFLHAGVIARLCQREPWLVVSVRPGADPVGALARELIRAAQPKARGGGPLEQHEKDSAQRLRVDLLEAPALLASRLATLAVMHKARVLLAVDQLEEAFTHGVSEREREQFLAMVCGAADDPGDPVRVVFTVRDDFLGKLAVSEVFVLRPLDEPAALRRIILEPLRRHRYELDDPTVVEDLIRDVAASPGSDLPLLQFACRMLWDGRDRDTRRLLRRTYEEMGGVVGALARHAERAVAGLDVALGNKVRRLFLHLVSGTTRRSVPRPRLLEQLGEDTGPLIDRLLAARLLVQRTLDDPESPVIEIAHESLLVSWPQLVRWLEESRDERRLLDELEEATADWERRGRRAVDTYSQDQLVSARQRARDLGVELPPRALAFLAAGDARLRAARRKRRWRVTLAVSILLITSIPLLTAVARFLAREHLIRVNAGTVDLVLSAYDWRDGAVTPVPISELPELALDLYAARDGDRDEPGAKLPGEVVKIHKRSSTAMERVERVTAPGGVIFLRIVGRGRNAESCAPSWIRILSFPGYGGKRAAPRWNVRVPTCQATHSDMLAVEAGPFIYGGTIDPPSPRSGHQDYTLPLREIDLPLFAMDRTEVPNARFEPFGKIEHLTGYLRPVYSNDEVHRQDGDPDRPVTEISWYTARAFCRYLGKDLPTDKQWVKAARGGLTIAGQKNPAPARLYPYGTTPRRQCVNVGEVKGAVDNDGYRWMAPVTAFSCGAGPYGHLNLVGNAQEWIAREGQPDPENPQYVIRGGQVDSPPELDHATTVFINHRSPRNFDYSIGVRCALVP